MQEFWLFCAETKYQINGRWDYPTHSTFADALLDAISLVRENRHVKI